MIKSLSKETINKIAAGEVVERPLNVVKELCENSIDAGATAISVEIKDGGKALIKVTDNGCGIEPMECETAFLRHTTSKIEDAEDLYRLSTLGFRGEALSSIAAVSKTELITKKEDNTLAKRLMVEGGEVTLNEDIAAPNGSTFFVRELFYNTPARQKFLKSNQMENSAIEEMMEKLALSRPDISFKLTIDGKEKIYTSGLNSLKNTIFEIYDLKTANAILDIDETTESFSVKGFIGKSVLAKKNRGNETFFVNGRYIKSSTLSEGLEYGFSGFLMQQGFPFCVLNLTFPEGSLDVNIHPSKMEVRFNDPLAIKELLRDIVSNRLSKREDIEKVQIETKVSKAENVVPIRHNPEPFEVTIWNETMKEKEETSELKMVSDDVPVVQLEIPFVSEIARPKHRIIGQVFDTYYLVEYEDDFYIIDQHAAHEKVLYERMMKSVNENQKSTQFIAPPIVVSLSPTEEALLTGNLSVFTDLGFSLEHFGGHDYRINGIPASLPHVDPKDLFLEILSTGSFSNIKNITERVASMACKAAVKGNNKLSYQEMDALLDELLTLENPYHCPHGRPTMISFSKYDLDKKFKRIL